MDKKALAKTIDHAILKPEQTAADLVRECAVAREYGVFSVCVKPSDVARAAELLQDSEVKVSTVIGFPHGGTTSAVKVSEAREAIENGAAELDMVINIGRLRSGDYDYVEAEIRGVVEAAHPKGVLVKVIIETALLDDGAKTTACRLAEKAGADFVKTSTGFGGGGATLADIELMRKTVGPQMQIKASGIRTAEFAAALLDAGCARLGVSGTNALLESIKAADGDY
ncbi:MAG: deoxyribose-phosphate aldolase [bacterium]|jgi:deoxyribose-phosphate aldolase